jgi:hypothetical protein
MGFSTYVVWVMLVVVANKMAALFAKRRAEACLHPYHPLPDILHEYIPRVNTHLPDYLLLILILYCIITRQYITIEQLNSLLLSLSIRPIFVCVTTIPTCMDKPNDKLSLYDTLFVSTHDLMFSGHTCLFGFIGIVIGGYTGFIIQYILPLTLIAARQHYTMDVLVAMVVYHSCLS